MSGPEDEYIDPHGECAAEIDRLRALNAELEKECARLRIIANGVLAAHEALVRGPR